MLDRRECVRQLERIAEIKGDCTIFDTHAHPLEFFLRGFEYRPNSDHPGVFTAGGATYSPPGVRPVKTEWEAGLSEQSEDPGAESRLMLMALRRIYAHTGPGVFGAQMALGHIDKCLLLPVTVEHPEVDDPLQLTAELFGDDPRFLFAFCPPNSVPNDRLTSSVRAAIERHDVRVIKIHPAVTGIDLESGSGVERIEHILEASRISGLGVIAHGGRSPYVSNPHAVDFGTLEKWQRVDWTITGEPVVIAHAGIFGYETSEAVDRVLPLLSGLLDRNDHLSVDLSGLALDAMVAVLNRVDIDRVLFGSDALYYAQWEAMVRFSRALELSHRNYEESFRAVASVNPSRLVDPGGRRHASIASH